MNLPRAICYPTRVIQMSLHQVDSCFASISISLFSFILCLAHFLKKLQKLHQIHPNQTEVFMIRVKIKAFSPSETFYTDFNFLKCYPCQRLFLTERQYSLILINLLCRCQYAWLCFVKLSERKDLSQIYLDVAQTFQFHFLKVQ